MIGTLFSQYYCGRPQPSISDKIPQHTNYFNPEQLSKIESIVKLNLNSDKSFSEFILKDSIALGPCIIPIGHTTDENNKITCTSGVTEPAYLYDGLFRYGSMESTNKGQCAFCQDPTLTGIPKEQVDKSLIDLIDSKIAQKPSSQSVKQIDKELDSKNVTIFLTKLSNGKCLYTPALASDYFLQNDDLKDAYLKYLEAWSNWKKTGEKAAQEMLATWKSDERAAFNKLRPLYRLNCKHDLMLEALKTTLFLYTLVGSIITPPFMVISWYTTPTTAPIIIPILLTAFAILIFGLVLKGIYKDMLKLNQSEDGQVHWPVEQRGITLLYVAKLTNLIFYYFSYRLASSIGLTTEAQLKEAAARLRYATTAPCLVD